MKTIPKALDDIKKLKDLLEDEEDDEKVQNFKENEITFPNILVSVELCDFEDLINKFDGSPIDSIKKWIQGVEDEAVIQELNDRQSLALAKNALPDQQDVMRKFTMKQILESDEECFEKAVSTKDRHNGNSQTIR